MRSRSDASLISVSPDGRVEFNGDDVHDVVVSENTRAQNSGVTSSQFHSSEWLSYVSRSPANPVCRLTTCGLPLHCVTANGMSQRSCQDILTT